MINPITDICWECIFPITLSGINVMPNTKDFATYNTLVCRCPGVPPKIGVPITFWEPARMIDVTRHAYTLVGLGGIKVGKESLKNRGTVGSVAETPSHTSFYHVHYFVYPILSLLGLLTDFQCVEAGDLDVAYMSEFDPLWGSDELQNIFNPEAYLFSNPLAQLACIADCAQASIDKPADKLFWCAGCQGSLYPFGGNVGHHVGPLQASSLLVRSLPCQAPSHGNCEGVRRDRFL